jgi:hypothetical protein
LIKDFIIDRIKGILTGLGGLGKAIKQMFSGDFEEAWKTAKQATKDLTGLEAAKKAVGGFKQIGKDSAAAYQSGVNAVAAKKAKKDGVIAGTDTPWAQAGVGSGSSGSTGASGSATQTVAGGGSKTTSINISIGKMVESVIFENGGVKDNKEELTKQMEEIIARILYAAQSAS